MDTRTRLEANLAAESEAYGYTLSVWGAGALLVHAYGVPGAQRVLAYVGGALVGFGALAVLAFRSISEEATPPETPSTLVVSTVHFVATGGTVGLVHLFVAAASGLRGVVVFFTTGVVVTVAYNLLLLFEEIAVRAVA